VGAWRAATRLKFDLRRFFARTAGPLDRIGMTGIDDAIDTDYLPASAHGEGLETDYQGLIASHFRRFGISNRCVSIEVRKLGHAPDGYDAFVGMVRLVRWDDTSAYRLLLGLPLLEARIRKAVRTTWLADYSHFGGLWLHASERLELPLTLRGTISSLAPQSHPDADTRPGHSDHDIEPLSEPR